MFQSVKIIKKSIEADRYEWPCPNCKARMFQWFNPPDNQDMLCRTCSENQWIENKEKWIKQFKKSLNWLIGATITDVEPDTEYWNEFKPDITDIVSLRIEKDGQAWDVSTANDVIHLYVIQVEE